MQKKRIIFFPRRNTPLKRYVSYFPTLTLCISNGENPEVILCHSRGLDNAIQYCKENDISPLIVSMDGVQIDIPENIRVINFRPECKKDLGDESMYYDTIYYAGTSHHPYMIRNIRNHILKYL